MTRWTAWIRQGHRWLAGAFTLVVLVAFAAPLLGPPPAWIYYGPLLPLAFLLLSGLWLLAQPHLRRRA
jgi:hypothetical protein